MNIVGFFLTLQPTYGAKKPTKGVSENFDDWDDLDLNDSISSKPLNVHQPSFAAAAPHKPSQAFGSHNTQKPQQQAQPAAANRKLDDDAEDFYKYVAFILSLYIHFTTSRV